MNTADLTEDAIVEWCRRSRAAQGLPERIVDGSVLARVVTLALAPVGDRDGKGSNGHGP